VGRTVSETQASVSSDEFTRWRAFRLIYGPLWLDRLDNVGLLVSTAVFDSVAAKGQPRQWKPERIMPWIDESELPPMDDEDEELDEVVNVDAWNALAAAAAQAGAKVIPPTE